MLEGRGKNVRKTGNHFALLGRGKRVCAGSRLIEKSETTGWFLVYALCAVLGTHGPSGVAWACCTPFVGQGGHEMQEKMRKEKQVHVRSIYACA